MTKTNLQRKIIQFLYENLNLCPLDIDSGPFQVYYIKQRVNLLLTKRDKTQTEPADEMQHNLLFVIQIVVLNKSFIVIVHIL